MVSAWFLSDIHINHLDEPRAIALLDFLESLRKGDRPATHVYFLGDIFDLWIGDHRVFRRKYGRFISMVSELMQEGIKVEYFEGNHDVHVAQFWRHMSVPTWTESRDVKIDGLVLRLEHGDLINLEDTTYLKYRSFIRTSTMQAVAQILPGMLLDRIGRLLSHESRKRTGPARRAQEDKIRAMIRKHADREFARAPFDAIIAGHMHVRDEYELVDPQASRPRATSFNLGSWFEEHTVLNLRDGQFSWVKLDT